MQYEYIYGKNTIRRALLENPQSIAVIYLLKNNNVELQTILQLATQHNISIQYLDAIKLLSISGSDAHQGVVARAHKLVTYYDDVLKKYEAKSSAMILALDNIQDPHNFGAIIRSAEALGVTTIIVPERNHAALNSATRKVACGAAELVEIVMVTNLVRTLEYLKTLNFWIVGADVNGVSPQTLDFKKIVLIMGSEGDGLRALTKQTCDQLVGIHLQGKTESLNVSVATGILLYALQKF